MARCLKITVTGASGFVAKNLRKYLSRQGVDLVSISRRDFKGFKSETRIISENYKGRDMARIKDSDALVHLVGIGRQSVNADYDAVNTDLTRQVVNLCHKAGIGRIIFLSGLGTGPNTSLGYFISKYNAERRIIDSGLNYTIFRPSYIVGSDDLLSQSLKKQIKSGKITIPGSGRYSIQPIHVSDVAKVILKSISGQKFKDRIVDLVGPDCMTFVKYARLFSKGTGAKIIKMNLEEAYHDAITNPGADFGVDDLNILIGDFKGDHKRLARVSGIEFQSIPELFQSGRLP